MLLRCFAVVLLAAQTVAAPARADRPGTGNDCYLVLEAFTQFQVRYCVEMATPRAGLARLALIFHTHFVRFLARRSTPSDSGARGAVRPMQVVRHARVQRNA